MNKLFALLFFVMLSTGVMAQKVGYVNTDAVLSVMPSAKTAQANFEAYAKTIVTPTITQKSKLIETKMTDFKANAQTMGEARREVVAKEIMKLEQELAQLHAQNGTEQKLAQKQRELFGPVQEKAANLIETVAKENGFTVVMDPRGLVYADKSANLLPLIKAKLGVQ